MKYITPLPFIELLSIYKVLHYKLPVKRKHTKTPLTTPGDLFYIDFATIPPRAGRLFLSNNALFLIETGPFLFNAMPNNEPCKPGIKYEFSEPFRSQFIEAMNAPRWAPAKPEPKREGVPPTDKQLAYLKRLGVKTVPRTKQEASLTIADALK